jgi:arginine kinase
MMFIKRTLIIFNIFTFQHKNMVVYLEQARKNYLNAEGQVDWSKVAAKWEALKKVKQSLANKHFNEKVTEKAKTLSQEEQHRLLDIMMGGL